MKYNFDKKSQKRDVLVLRWDARKDEKGKHGNFDNLWIGPFKS